MILKLKNENSKKNMKNTKPKFLTLQILLQFTNLKSSSIKKYICCNIYTENLYSAIILYFFTIIKLTFTSLR